MPANFGEAMKAYDAVNGYKLAESPRIKPDGKPYYVMGRIYRADDQTAIFMGKVVGLSNRSNYVGVKVPKQLEALCFEKAQINQPFSVVGKPTIRCYDG